jgi:hypothetical protein
VSRSSVLRAYDLIMCSAGGNPLGQLFGPESLVRLAGHPKFGKYLADETFMSKWRLLQANPNMLQNIMQARSSWLAGVSSRRDSRPHACQRIRP